MSNFDFNFDPDASGARTTEGWVKHDLEAGQLGTFWLRCAAVDALMDSPDDPTAYVLDLLSHVDVPDAAKVEALAIALTGTVADESKQSLSTLDNDTKEV